MTEREIVYKTGKGMSLNMHFCPHGEIFLWGPRPPVKFTHLSFGVFRFHFMFFSRFSRFRMSQLVAPQTAEIPSLVPLESSGKELLNGAALDILSICGAECPCNSSRKFRRGYKMPFFRKFQNFLKFCRNSGKKI